MGIFIISLFKETHVELLSDSTSHFFSSPQTAWMSLHCPDALDFIQAEGGRGRSCCFSSSASHSLSTSVSFLLFLIPLHIFLPSFLPSSLSVTQSTERVGLFFCLLCGMNLFLAIFFLTLKRTLICFDCDTM